MTSQTGNGNYAATAERSALLAGQAYLLGIYMAVPLVERRNTTER